MNKFLVASALGIIVIGGWAATEYSRAEQTKSAAVKNEVKIEERDGFGIITSNGIPDHPTGQFPHPGNPGRIAPQHFVFRMTLAPKIADKLTWQRNGKFGVVLNGVPLDPGTNEWWNNDRRAGWQEVAHAGTDELGLDESNAHVQPDGTYHYHGLPYGWLDKLPDATKPQNVLTGYAGDGFPIYSLFGYANPKDPKSKIVKLRSSYRVRKGTRPDAPDGPGGTYDGTYSKDYKYVAGAGDLDECNGREGVTPEYPKGTYYYVLTEEFPFIPRYFRGTPDASWARRPGPPPGGEHSHGGERGDHGPDDNGPEGGPPPDEFGPPPDR